MFLKGAKARKTFHWEDINKGENVMYRIPRNIRWNDNVVVREDETAVFFRDGKAMHVFDRGGRYAMTTENVPVLGRLAAAATGIKQLGEIYYIQRRELRSKFGTVEPLTFRDTDFGLVRIRVFGSFAYKVTDPLVFITQFVGTEEASSSGKVVDWMKSQVVMCLNDALGELKRDKNMAVVDMPAYLQEIEQVVLSKIVSDAQRYGLKITKIIGLNINLPEEVQEAIDKRGAMGALGTGYMQYQTGRAVEDIGKGAAAGGGGAPMMTGMGAGMGAGFGIATEMSKGMAQPPPSSVLVKCQKCSSSNPETAKFCQNCGAKLGKATIKCPKCNTDLEPNVKFCSSCGTKLLANCPKCNAVVTPGTKFCSECGAGLTE